MKLIKAREILETCERELRTLVAESASRGDYPGVMSLTALARAVADLSVRAEEGNAEPRPDALPQRDSSGVASVIASRGATDAKRSKQNYPQFFRKGDELVKVGWSKRDRKEYHHRAPRAAVDAIALALKKAGTKGRLFNGGDLMPVKGLESSAVVPDYQVYLVLAWLKDLGVVKQRGRRAGYTLGGDLDLGATVEAGWPKLMEWRG
jgi:hypothetical protein